MTVQKAMDRPTTRTVGNVDKQVVVAIGLVAIIFLIGLAYIVREPTRMAEARQQQLANAVAKGTETFVSLCSSCHGQRGEGGIAKPLNKPEFRTGSAQDLDKAADLLRKTISRGRYGTAMPAWGQDDGGPLNMQQIDDLVTMIQHGDWDIVAEKAAAVPKQQPPAPGSTGATANNEAHPGAEPASQGKQIFHTRSCAACHGQNLEGGVGPSLRHLASQPALLGGAAPMNADSLRKWLADPASMKPGTAMPKLGLSESEIEALVAFLLEQR